MINAICRDCGTWFRRELADDWKVRCVRCWTQRKRKSYRPFVIPFRTMTAREAAIGLLIAAGVEDVE